MAGLRKKIMGRTAVAALIALAYIPNLLWWMFDIHIPDYFSHQSNFIYIGLLAVWGISIRHRIIQRQVRRFLMDIAALMVFWIIVRSLKYYFVSDLNIIRQLWYAYYIPMLMIPCLSVFVALSLGKPEYYRLPKWTAVLLIPTGIFILLVLTNDLHQLIFAFPEGKVWTDKDYSYGLTYWLLSGWELTMALISLGTFIAKSRVPHSRKVLWQPFVPLTFSVIYGALYVTSWPMLRFFARDMTIILCLLFTAILESCIQCGLIQSNSGYAELFRASTIGARIIDRGGRLHLCSEGAEPMAEYLLLETEAAPVWLPGGIRLSSAPINGGHVVWQEDLSELISVISEIKEASEELKGKNAILAEEYKTRHTRQALVEKNRLYNKVQTQTQAQIKRLGLLIELLDKADTADETCGLISHIAVLTAYIKRRNNLIFIAEESGLIPPDELRYCMRETTVNLELAGTKCHVRMGLTEPLPAGQIAFLYDKFSAVVEASINSLKTLYCSVLMEKGRPSMNLIIMCDEDLTALSHEGLFVQREGEKEWAFTCAAP